MSDLEKVVPYLQALGYSVSSVDELRESGVRYRSAIPVLLDWLLRLESPQDKEWLVRALSVPWAREHAVGPLIAEFKAAPAEASQLRWAIGNAFDVLWDDAHFESLVSLAQDRSYGRDREMIVLGMAKSKRPEAMDLLISLTNDPDVSGHATMALRKRGEPGAEEAFRRMQGDSRAWVRREAAKGLTKLQKQRP